MFQSLKGITYQVNDLEKAKNWYSQVLNKEPVIGSVFIMNNFVLTLELSENKVSETNNSTVAHWMVENIEDSYKKLIDLGAIPSSEIINIVNVKVAKLIDPFGNTIGIMETIAPKKRVEDQPSETANKVAFYRALSIHDKREEIKGNDYLAKLFINEEDQKKLEDNYLMSEEFSRNLPGYLIIIARTAFIDSLFSKALNENIPQIVFLGAGYDTRSLRFSNDIKNTKIFELDVETTQQRKKDILEKSNIQIPDQLSFVSINFNKDKLEDVLFKAGYDKNKKTLFIWEGVTFYLPIEAIIETLKFIKNNSGKESSVFFDYMVKEVPSFYSGEPFKFWIAPEKIEQFLDDNGFSVIEHLSIDEIKNRFLTLKNGDILGSVANHFSFIHADIK